MSDRPGSTDPEAFAAGVNAALSEASGAMPVPVQGSLFGAEPVDPDGIGELPAERRGPGRPAGSRNKSTEEWSRFILSRYRSPLLGLAEIAQATPAALQTALGGAPSAENKAGVSLADCLRIIMQAQALLAPYLHQKQPTAIDTGGVGMLTIQIGDIGDAEGAVGMKILPVGETVENQGVSIPDAEVSE